MALILESDAVIAQALAAVVPAPARALAAPVSPTEVLGPEDDLIVIGPSIPTDVALALAFDATTARPHLGVVLVRHHDDADVLRAAMRSGVRDVVAFAAPAELAAACARSLETSRARRQQSETTFATAPSGGQIITVFAAKGGVGKTTIATNLAVTLAERGARRVCLLDLDLAFGDVAIVLQLFPTKTLGDAVALSRLDETAVHSLVTRHSSGLDVLAAPVDPGTSESISAGLITDLLNVLSGIYEVVVIDTPPAFTEQVLAAFDQSDRLVLPATLDIPSVKNLKLTLETLDLLGFAPEKRHVLLNRSDAKVGLTVNDVEKSLQTSIAMQIPSSRAVPSSVNRGVPIVVDQPGHPVSVALRRFAAAMAPRRTKAPVAKLDRRVLRRARRANAAS